MTLSSVWIYFCSDGGKAAEKGANDNKNQFFNHINHINNNLTFGILNVKSLSSDH